MRLQHSHSPIKGIGLEVWIRPESRKYGVEASILFEVFGVKPLKQAQYIRMPAVVLLHELPCLDHCGFNVHLVSTSSFTLWGSKPLFWGVFSLFGLYVPDSKGKMFLDSCP